MKKIFCNQKYHIFFFETSSLIRSVREMTCKWMCMNACSVFIQLWQRDDSTKYCSDVPFQSKTWRRQEWSFCSFYPLSTFSTALKSACVLTWMSQAPQIQEMDIKTTDLQVNCVRLMHVDLQFMIIHVLICGIDVFRTTWSIMSDSGILVELYNSIVRATGLKLVRIEVHHQNWDVRFPPMDENFWNFSRDQ